MRVWPFSSVVFTWPLVGMMLLIASAGLSSAQSTPLPQPPAALPQPPHPQRPAPQQMPIRPQGSTPQYPTPRPPVAPPPAYPSMPQSYPPAIAPKTSPNGAGTQLTPAGAKITTNAATTTPAKAAPTTTTPKTVSNHDRRKAIKLYLKAAKLFKQSKFEAAQALDEQCARLDPTNPDYPVAAEVARSHAVTAWVQAAAKTRVLGDAAGARADLAHALQIDPKNPIITQHLDDLANDATTAYNEPKPFYLDASNTIAPLIQLLPSKEKKSFHEKAELRTLVRNFYKTYGISVSLDSSMSAQTLRFDLDDATFAEASPLFDRVTHTFYTPLDPHRVVVARDNSDTRQQFMRRELETIYLPGLNEKEIADIVKVMKEMFDLQQVTSEPTTDTITVRAQPLTLDSMNTTLRLLLDGHGQVLLDIHMIQLAQTKARNTGVQVPQQLNVFNVGIEEQALLNENQALVQQIISSGLANANDPLAILGILLASGQVTDPILKSLVNNGVGVFGGGSSLTAVTPLTSTLNLSVNSSDSRTLDTIQLRLGDGEAGTVKLGSRYPIITSSFSSSLPTSASTIPGLNTAGVSSSLASLATSALGALNTTPMIEYQDIGLTLKATANVKRDANVALTLDLKLTTLAGPSVNGIPVLNNQAYSGVVTVREGEATVIASEISKQESRALSGVPGITELPGLNDLTDVNKSLNYASLIIVITPHIMRGTQAGGHSPILRIDRKADSK